MKVLVAGSSGLIGSALCHQLVQEGNEVARLVRREPQGSGEMPWDPDTGSLSASAFDGVDAVVHLGGRNIAAGRWTAKFKAELLESRVRSTELIAATLSRLAEPPQVLICASAIGIYGDRGGEELSEQSGVGSGFLAELGQAWEGASAVAADRGIRVVQARFGIVLSRRGGALAKMLWPFRLGMGGKVGNGRQYFSWIGLEDVVSALLFVLQDANLSGPLNLTAPNPVTNAELTRVLGRILRRPTLAPLPAFVARLVLGGLADEGILASQRVLPAKLLRAGFDFHYPDLTGALRRALGH